MKTFWISIAVLIGCSSSASVRTISDGGSIEEAMAGMSGGENDDALSTGDSGNADGHVGSGGFSGDGGSINDAGLDGLAGAVGEGGTSGIDGSGGSGGVCVPKTCDTYSFEQTGAIGMACGIIPNDGCGNILNCGNNCPGFTACGAGKPLSDSNNAEKGINNICGGGCIFNFAGCCNCSDTWNCLGQPESPALIIEAQSTCIKKEDTVFGGVDSPVDGYKASKWCCS